MTLVDHTAVSRTTNIMDNKMKIRQTSNGLNHLCDNTKKLSKTKFNFILITSVILICALSIHYLFYKQDSTEIISVLNDEEPVKQEKISITKKNDKVKPEIKVQTDTKSDFLKKSSFPKVNDELNYDPEAMVHFTDQILKSTLDDFVTIEKMPIKLQDISKFNNIHFAPRILSLVKLDPFKFVKFNLKRPCLLWSDTFSCTKMSCNIKFCNRSELPKAYLVLDESCPTDSPKELSKLDQTLTQNNVKELNKLFECSRDDSEESQYYDLILNPERYTGYDGKQIWKAIYEENCFPMKNRNIFSLLNNGCYEERIFYRIISGLHTSITIHLTSIHHKFKDHFGPNPKDYFKRFYGHEDYIKNLFFTYLIELRALYKSQSYLLNQIKWNSIGDKVQAKDAIKALLNTETMFKWHFDEKVLFKHEPIAEQLGYMFNNITFNIMDCVSCDKCRLWGKVQTNGLGTALKIMFTEDMDKLKLSHHEITCLLNAVARLSYSITQISNFREILLDKANNKLNANENVINDNGRNFVEFLK